MKHDHRQDEAFMRRAMDLARLGSGRVSPNPLVGCVVVHDNRIVGEGWHRQYGGPHAEVNALNNVNNPAVLSASTVYVNLEPCSHTGKTPPCADALIHHRIPRVVMANVDTNPLVGGSGIKKLREAGIEVITGILEREGRELNHRFFTCMEKNRPYVVLKWAQTADGFLARENLDSKWISNEYSRQLVHKWRSEEDSILVGTRTVFHDNPRLTVRDWSGRNPVRIVIDRFLKLSRTLHVFDHSVPTLVYNVMKHEEHDNLKFIRLDELDFLPQLLKDLHHRKIASVLVEGGAQTLKHFIDTHLWDEARVFVSEKSFGKGLPAPALSGNLTVHDYVHSDALRIYKPVPERSIHT
jgi:diaminohydroxyphosphoribosylaminopyrimidine deaminase/5-amino-6-(5-phosphoribosylamino)uracil reductase